MAVKGGVVSLSITWNCDLDLDFMENCLPKYSFRILEEGGYNFRHAKYHEENRRTLYKMYGIKVIKLILWKIVYPNIAFVYLRKVDTTLDMLNTTKKIEELFIKCMV